MQANLVDKRGTWFNLTRSTTRDCQVVEVWYQDRFIATINPLPSGLKGEPSAISVTSKHAKEVLKDNNFPPVLMISFDPKE